MTKTSMTLLALTAALALSACGKQEAPHAAAKGEAAAHSSSAGLPHGNADNGRKLANEGINGGASCVSCHGADGDAPIVETYPKVGGQYADYIAHALQAYRDGSRAGGNADIMASQAKGLTDQQIADLAAYFGGVQGQLRDLHGLD